MTDSIDGTALASNLCIQHHQVLQTFLHIPLGIDQTALLLLDLLLNLFALLLQILYSSRMFRFSTLATFSRLAGLACFFSHHSLLRRRLTTLLRLRSHGKGHKE